MIPGWDIIPINHCLAKIGEFKSRTEYMFARKLYETFGFTGVFIGRIILELRTADKYEDQQIKDYKEIK